MIRTDLFRKTLAGMASALLLSGSLSYAAGGSEAAQPIRQNFSDKAKKLPDAECNPVVLHARGDAVGLSLCGIALFNDEINANSDLKKQIEGAESVGLMNREEWRDARDLYNERMSFYRQNIAYRELLIQAVNDSSITKKDAMVRLDARVKKEEYRFQLIAALGEMVATKFDNISNAPMPPAEPQKPPTSITCGKRDWFGNVKCDFN